MQIPEKLLQSLEGVKGYDKQAFQEVHTSGEQITSVRFNPLKWAKKIHPDAAAGSDHQSATTTHFSQSAYPVPWSSYGFYLSERPLFTFDPLFHAGVYYVQEASSMFLEQVLKQTVDLSQPLRVLDLCAAPGGKSTLLQSLISKESLLVSNEVIKSRVAVLEENITRWGAPNIIVTNNDPAHFARLKNYFDVIVVDAPCSGSGLFRRDAQAIQQWSNTNVQLCNQRQQRILADAWPALKQDGILIYSTCSYSTEENEDILDWIAGRFRVKGIRLEVAQEWKIIETGQHALYGYRFYPDKVKGEGFFITALKKKEGDVFTLMKTVKNNTQKLSATEEGLVKPWLQQDANLALFRQKEAIIALPAGLEKEISVLQSAAYIKKAGVTIGRLAGKDLIPDHALAVSTLANKSIPIIELNVQQAIQYLRRDDIQLITTHRGWALANYQGHHLGWIKVLPQRFNNYYPKEWRIIKQPV